MKKSLNLLLILLAILFVSACEKNQLEEFNTENHEDLPLYGKWFLTEYGYSPGSGYVTNKVNPDPQLFVTFGFHDRMTSNLQEMMMYKYYKIEKNADSELLFVYLFSEKPDDTLSLSEQSARIYLVNHEDPSLLKLHMIGCIEGCHLGFKPANL